MEDTLDDTQARMDSVIADAYTDAANKGRSVAVVGITRAAAQDALKRFKETSGAMNVEFRLTKGAEEMRMPSGGKVFLAAIQTGGLRGTTVDRIYVPYEMLTPELAEEIVPAIVTSDEPAITAYL